MYKLGKKSRENLEGVKKPLVEVVEFAIQLTSVDFGVTEGLRSWQRQQALVDRGSSWTMKSRHLTGHAVDVVAYDDGVVTWDMVFYGRIAEAFSQASLELDIEITWGAVWDKPLVDLTLGDGLMDDIDSYVYRFKQKHGRRPRLDGPHFELSKKEYPV